MDDLPIWGMVGELTTTDMDEGGELEGEALVYTHKRFSVSYNGDRIIQVCCVPRMQPRTVQSRPHVGAHRTHTPPPGEPNFREPRHVERGDAARFHILGGLVGVEHALSSPLRPLPRL